MQILVYNAYMYVIRLIRFSAMSQSGLVQSISYAVGRVE
jgi:hypothetical protein